MTIESEAINKHVRAYQVAANWDHRAEAEFQHRFFDLINERLFREEPLPQPVISMEQSRRRVELGYYLHQPNSMGLCHQINISQHTLETQTSFQRLETLLHEAVHMWQAVHRSKTLPKTSWYHGRVWAAKAREVGIIANPRTGCTERLVEPFIGLVRDFGVTDPIPDYASESEIEIVGRTGLFGTGKGSTLKKWVCDCIPSIALRVGRREIRVKCLDCGGQFKRIG